MFFNSTLWSVNSQEITKIGASRYQILRLKCTKFTFCWGSAPDPAWGAYSAPRPLPLFKGPTSKGMEGNGRGRKGKGERRGEVEGGIWPTQKFWCGAPYENVTLRSVDRPLRRTLMPPWKNKNNIGYILK